MKPFSIMAGMLLLVAVHLKAQKRMTLDEKSVVATGDGTVLPMSIWQPLMMKGRYDLQWDSASHQSNRFIIRSLSDSAYNARLAAAPKPKESPFFRTGSTFSMKAEDMNGNKINTKDLKGAILVVNFWFINCPPCKMEIPDLNNIVQTYKDTANIKFVAVALDDKDALQTFLKGMPFNYQIVNQGKYITDGFGVHSFPTHVVVDGDGKIYFHTTGLSPHTAYWIKKSIQELLAKRI